MIVYEFRVRSGAQQQFEEAYGSHGEWGRLFQQDPAYIRTELMQDVHEVRRYLTLDFWVSEAAYEAFRQNRKDEYQRIDLRCEQMTEAEREIGRFTGSDHGGR